MYLPSNEKRKMKACTTDMALKKSTDRKQQAESVPLNIAFTSPSFNDDNRCSWLPSQYREMVRKAGKHKRRKQTGEDLCFKVLDPVHLLIYAY